MQQCAITKCDLHTVETQQLIFFAQGFIKHAIIARPIDTEEVVIPDPIVIKVDKNGHVQQ